MTGVRLDPEILAHGFAELCAADPALDAARENYGSPTLRRWPPGFQTLLDVIIGQQVSSASAAAVRAKLRAAIDPLTPETLLAAGEEVLRACGLSRQKNAYARDLSSHIVDGRLAIDQLATLPEDEVIRQLVAVKGVGRWTAEIYLLFSLGRADVWPADDLALAIAAQHLRGLAEKPNAKATRALAEVWAPWRGVAAHALWHFYPGMIKRRRAGQSLD